MRKIDIFYLCIICSLLPSCSTWKKTFKSVGNTENAIENSIIDFSHTSKLWKKNMVFSIKVTDLDEKIIVAIVAADDYDIYPRKENKIGTFDSIFPTKYVVKNNKLFYWNDSTQAITQDIISVLEKYNKIDWHWEQESAFPPYLRDDGIEGVIYYFCKNDLINYKKSGVSNIRRHYKSPILKCN